MLTGAVLQEVNLTGANLREADLFLADLRTAIYEPIPESLPYRWMQLGPNNYLAEMVFKESPAALITLREAFKRTGMRTQERELTHAIERSRRLQAWNPSWIDRRLQEWHPPEDPEEDDEDTRPWLERLAGKSESLFRYVLFELPSGYGMAPGRALRGLLGLIPIFALPYWIAVRKANSRSGIWMIVPADRIASGRGQEKVVLMRPHTAKTWRERLSAEYRMFRTSLYFSLLCAFHLGWRELNVGAWIARVQPREYTLRATGWVRTVSGIQSLISVYLLALWVLTYFGRPFE
jgi:Pentapeptide repeats (8 copies)